MKKTISLVMTSVILFLTICLSGCQKQDNNMLNVYNWGEYMDMSVIDEFTKETGIRVNYKTYDSNEAMFSKISTGAAGYDIVFPSDYMISKMIEEDMLAELDFNNIPNYKYIGDDYKNLEFDPDNKYSVPYTWGTVVILYDKTKVDPKDVKDQSINLLWNQKYKDQILMFDNPRDAFGLALIKNGYSINSDNPAEWDKAAESLIEQKPLIQAYVMDQIFDKLGTGEAAVAPYYAGDAILIKEQNPNIEYYIPKEGTNMFVDSICVLKTSTRKEQAEKFIDFLCRTDVAVKTAEEIGYATPHSKAFLKLDKETTSDSCIYPSSEILQNTEVFKNLDKSISIHQSDLWIKVKAS